LAKSLIYAILDVSNARTASPMWPSSSIHFACQRRWQLPAFAGSVTSRMWLAQPPSRLPACVLCCVAH